MTARIERKANMMMKALRMGGRREENVLALGTRREGEKMGGIEVSRECGRKSCPWREVGGHGQGSGGVATCMGGGFPR